MPELPEVETIRRELEKAVLGKTLIGVRIHNPKVIRSPSEPLSKIGKGTRIEKILRKAKVLILELSNGKSLVIHLKMTGQLIYPGGGGTSRVSFLFSDGKALDLNDRRLFAEVRLLEDWKTLKFIRELGPEPFELSHVQFRHMLSGKKTKIKPLLMDQTFISGIGNLYANEALFRAKIHPRRPASSLSKKEQENLLKEIKATLDEAIRYKGSSVDQYVRLNGSPGDYKRLHRIYDREGRPCTVCRTPIKKMALAGRGTYFCPECQG